MQDKPLHWTMVELRDVADKTPNSFVDGPFGSNLKTDEYSQEGVRLIQLQNIGDGSWIDDNKRFIPPRKFEELERHAAYPGDIAIAKMADPVARACLIPTVAEQFVVVADCIRLAPDPKEYDPQFLVYAINHRDVRRQAERISTGTTRQRINLSTLKTLRLWVPPLPEQRRIAEILDAADDAIRQTEQVIAKLKAVKAGLLHDLLTRGLDAEGRLRDPEAHPEQFKDSPLGRIPNEWRTVNLETIAELITSGSRGWAAYYSQQGPIFLRIGNLTREHINLKLDSLVHVRPPLGSERVRSAVQEGDILISITADLGIIGVIPPGFGEAYVNQHIALVRVNPAMANPRWVGTYLAGAELAQKQFYRLNDMGAKAGMNLPTTGAVLVALPPMHEQKTITTIIDAQDARIRTEEVALHKLRQVKRGLMDDLLTGRVRVGGDWPKTDE
jgi:type I restriction enzyme, S subunit